MDAKDECTEFLYHEWDSFTKHSFRGMVELQMMFKLYPFVNDDEILAQPSGT